MIKTTKTYLGISALLCIAAMAAWWWVLAEISDTKMVMQDHLTTIATLESQRVSRDALAAAVEASIEQRNAVEAVYLQRDEVISFLTTIESLSVRDVTVSVETLKEVETADGMQVEIPLAISGTVRAVETTLDTLESLPYASYLDSLSLSRTTLENGGVGYDATVTLVVALQPESV